MPEESVAANAEICSLQMAMGFNPLVGSDTTLDIARALKSALPADLGGDTVMPPGKGIPPFLPRLILQDKSENFRCEVALSRASLRWKPSRGITVAMKTGWPPFEDACKTVAGVFLDTFKISVSGLGAMAILRSRQGQDPLETVAGTYLLPDALGGLEDIEVGGRKALNVGSLPTNLVLRVRSHQHCQQIEGKSCLEIMLDVNTFQVKSQRHDRNQVLDFISNARMAMEEAASSYLPSSLRVFV